MGVLINGVYYSDESKAPTADLPAISSQLQSYEGEQAMKKYDKDFIQPYGPDGPNPEFAKYYPDKAKDYGMENLL